MTKHEEDEIQVLGSPAGGKRPVRNRWLWGIVVLLLVAVACIVCWWCLPDRNNRPVGEKVFPNWEKNILQLDKKQQPLTDSATYARVSLLADTVNDVPMQLFVLEGTDVRLCIGLPSVQDTTLLMALPAADVRKDNLGIVGDFVLDGRRYGNGKRKEGYGALLQGQLFLGVSASDTVMNYCAERQGSFFRQYPLVIGGKIWPNRLKGKSLRRAVACKKDDPRVYVVLSRQRESLYDFSEALADYGMLDALYLPGGDAYAFCRTPQEILWLGTSQEHVYPNTSYLVFHK